MFFFFFFSFLKILNLFILIISTDKNFGIFHPNIFIFLYLFFSLIFIFYFKFILPFHLYFSLRREKWEENQIGGEIWGELAKKAIGGREKNK